MEKDIGVQERKSKYGEYSEPVTYALKAYNEKAKVASILTEKWGMMAKVDGEDSAGRQKLALFTPDEIVARACDAAELLFAEYVKRGWSIDVPAPYKLEKE